MISTELLSLFAEALEVESSSITPETMIADVPEWTSVAWLTIMALLDDRYGVQLEAKEIRGFKTVKDAVDCITSKAGVTG